MTCSETKKVLALHLFLLALLCFLFLFAGLGQYSLKEPDEGRYAEVAREMADRGDYVVPRLNYVRYFEKPPLCYWLIAGSYHLFGVNEFGFRFPNALLAFLTVLSVYWYSRRWFGPRPALLGSAILCSCFGFCSMARIATLDMSFTFFLFLSFAGLWGFLREQRRRFLLLLYIAAALATLTKGPVAIILIATTALFYCVVERSWRLPLALLWPPGIVAYLIIALPWFVIIGVREQGFLSFFFVDQHILRFLTTQHKRTGPFYYFLPVLLGGLLPWSAFVPRAIMRLWRVPDVRVLLLWSITVLLFFSASGSKLPPYILPALPALAIVLGLFFDGTWDAAVRGAIDVMAFSCLLVAAGILLWIPVAWWTPQPLPSSIQDWLSLPGLRVSLYALGLSMAIAGFLPLVGILRTHRTLFLTYMGLAVFCILLVLMNMDLLNGVHTSRKISAEILRRGGTYDQLVNFNSFEESVPFYTRSRVIIAGYTGELELGSRYPDAEGWFISRDEFLRRFLSETRMLVVLSEKRLPWLQRHVQGRADKILCENGRCLVQNR